MKTKDSTGKPKTTKKTKDSKENQGLQRKSKDRQGKPKTPKDFLSEKWISTKFRKV